MSPRCFHAGTEIDYTRDDDRVVTSGGRVLCVTALGDTVTLAQHNAYQAVAKIHWDDAFFRTDIGHRAVSREAK